MLMNNLVLTSASSYMFDLLKFAIKYWLFEEIDQSKGDEQENRVWSEDQGLAIACVMVMTLRPC